MEGVKSFVESLKEFIWDIIGFIVPGTYFIILMSLTINRDYWLDLISFFDKQYYTYVIVMLSYLLGYAVYGLNTIFQNKLNEKSYKKIIEKKVINGIIYQTAKIILHKKMKDKNIDIDFDYVEIRDLRSIAMGFFPENDQKIYTFTFRGELANHAGTITFLFGVLGLVSTILNSIFTFDVIIVDPTHIVLYTLFVLSYFLFAAMRDRHYKISLELPFSILFANEINEKK